MGHKMGRTRLAVSCQELPSVVLHRVLLQLDTSEGLGTHARAASGQRGVCTGAPQPLRCSHVGPDKSLSWGSFSVCYLAFIHCMPITTPSPDSFSL